MYLLDVGWDVAFIWVKLYKQPFNKLLMHGANMSGCFHDIPCTTIRKSVLVAVFAAEVLTAAWPAV